MIDTKAPDVAPMSYPNSSPPIAGNRNTRDVMSQSTSRGVMAAADMSVCGASCNSNKTLFESHRKSYHARSVLHCSPISSNFVVRCRCFCFMEVERTYKETVPFLCSHKRFAPGTGTDEWHVGGESA